MCSKAYWLYWVFLVVTLSKLYSLSYKALRGLFFDPLVQCVLNKLDNVPIKSDTLLQNHD